MTATNRNKELKRLRNFYGRFKEIPSGFEFPILKALSYYPELLDEKIEFRLTKAKLPYFSRPKIWSLVSPFVKRSYVIGISLMSTDLREPTLLENLTLQSQIGAIGHELAHIVHYKNRSTLQVILDGVKYINVTFRGAYEKRTDEIAIRHGLGEEIHSWAKEVFPIKKRDGSRSEVYYTPGEIKDLLVRIRS